MPFDCRVRGNFECSLGVSPRDYVRRRRIEVAEALMLTTSEPLSERLQSVAEYALSSTSHALFAESSVKHPLRGAGHVVACWE
jgi:hypothetical protein